MQNCESFWIDLFRERIHLLPNFQRVQKDGAISNRAVFICFVTIRLEYSILAVNDFAAVRVKDLSADVTRVVACQKHVAIRHFFGLAGPLHRRIAAKTFHFFFVESTRN